jgi:hypothetical protein
MHFYMRHLLNYTNLIHNFYVLHMYTMFLLHVSVYLTPSSGRTYMFLAENNQLLQKLLSEVQWLHCKI